MSWDYDIDVGSVDLDTVATFATIEDELPSPFNDPGVQIPGRDGVKFDALAPVSPLVVTLRAHLRWTSAVGTITHVDGEAGHIYENLSLLKTELNGPSPILRRTLPHIGRVRGDIKMNTPGFVGAQRHIYHFPLTIPSGSWRDNNESSATGSPPSVVTSGNREIFDPRMSIPSSGTRTVATTERTYTITAAAGPTYPVVIHVGNGTVLDNTGDDASGAVIFSHEHWFRLSPAHTHVVTGSCTVFWRNRWA